MGYTVGAGKGNRVHSVSGVSYTPSTFGSTGFTGYMCVH